MLKPLKLATMADQQDQIGQQDQNQRSDQQMNVPPQANAQAQVSQPNAGNALPNNAIHRVQVKVPPFWKQDPALWFKQLEAHFANSNIVNDLTKFNTIVGVIESDILSTASDIVLNPPAHHLYRTIKQRLIKEFSDSEEKKLRNLLNDLNIGDTKPSSLLRKMREKACGKVGDELLKTIWLQRLPSTIQTVLFNRTDNLNELSVLADKMFDITESTLVQAINPEPNVQLDDLVNVVYKLDDKIESLQKAFRESKKSTKQLSHTLSSNQTTIPGTTSFLQIMGPDKSKRSASPAKLPTWLRDLIRELQLIRQDLHRNESNVRELREICLDLQRSVAINRRENPTISTRTRPAPIPTGSTQTVRSAPSKLTNAAKTAAVRDAAAAVLRPTRPDSSAQPRICWFHKQFGQTSKKCLEPCEFKAPFAQVSTPPAVKKRLSSAIVRVPLERVSQQVRKIKQADPDSSSLSSSSADSDPQPSTSPTNQAADWNKITKEGQEARLSESSDDSDDSQTEK